MLGLWIVLGGLAVVAAIGVAHRRRRENRREMLRKRGLSEAEHRLVEARFGLWRRLPDDLRRDAAGWVRVFLEEKSFEACGGLSGVSEEMRLAIAAPACLLIARRPEDYYERLRTVLVYPSAFTVRDEFGMEDVRLGESWQTGSVVLAWESVVQGSADPRDGLNVVIHEFAHQIDQADGLADGAPDFEEVEDYGRWSGAFAPAYEEFCERVQDGRRTVMDDYGAESPAEFFAVASETFFERAAKMKSEEPEIYAELARFYRMDPASW